LHGGIAAVPAFVDLPAIPASASDPAVLADPELAALVVEFTGWEMQLAECHDRRMPKTHDGFDEWIREGRTLFDDRDELKGRAYALLKHD
jgi:hypothetical protein